MIQLIVTQKEDTAQVCGVLKVTEMAVEMTALGIVVMLRYNTNHMHLTTTVCKNIKWINKTAKFLINHNIRWLIRRSIV